MVFVVQKLKVDHAWTAWSPPTRFWKLDFAADQKFKVDHALTSVVSVEEI
jgi:hypothetical protein